MTALEKKKFIQQLVSNIEADLVSKIPRMPKEWDGVELRKYIADVFAGCVLSGTMSRGRLKEYNNTILISGSL